jgi:hypothetical protein
MSYKVIQIMFYAAGGVAVVFLMIGGFQYIIGMSTGGDEAIGKAKKTITYAIIGLVIVILSGTIVLMVYNLVTNNSSGLSGTTGNSNTNNGGGSVIQTGGGNTNTGGGNTNTGGGTTITPPIIASGNIPVGVSISVSNKSVSSVSGKRYTTNIDLTITKQKLEEYCGKDNQDPQFTVEVISGASQGASTQGHISVAENTGFVSINRATSENIEKSNLKVSVCGK